MKRVFVAVALGGLLLVGAPTLASSAQRNDSRSEKGAGDKSASNKSTAEKANAADKSAADKGGNSGNKGNDNRGGGDNKGGDNKGGDRGDKGDRGHRGDRGDRGDRDGRHRHGHYRDGYYGGGYGYGYGEPYECYYGPSGAYNCEPYGGDYYGGYDGYRGGYNYGSRNRNVYVERHAFNPGEVHARVGQEVLWIFRDSDPHTVTADNKSFDSGEQRQGEFRLVFDQPGSYSYHCALHPDMKGRVLVG